ncbi:MAG: fibronectin type III domain-containing protein [Anaerolinea sp.]|nr:fibronectin type III domain-containing protein [Anaerolinea sp.]
MKKQFTCNKRRLLFFAMILLAVQLLVTPPDSTAQQTPEPPPRGVNRTAPEREPIVLSSVLQPDGTTNTVILLPAVADTYLASERPLQNFGSDALFLGYNLVGSDYFGAQRILLRFDVENFIPAGAVINSAALRLHVSFSSPTDDAPMGTVLRRLASPWSEFDVTWNTEPAWTPVDSTAEVGSQPTWYEWPLTDVVADWASNLYANDGVEIIGDETVQQRERSFYSRETLLDLYPRLIVDYTDFNDTQPPSVTVNPLPTYSGRNFTVSWTGDDPGGSGIDHYDVQVQAAGGDWVDWLTNVIVTEAVYGNGEDGRVYNFRARGVDNAGNIESFGPAEATTIVDTLPPTSTVAPLPVINNSNSFLVSWSGTDSASGIQYYDVQYRFNNGPWMLWLPQTLSTSATFFSATDGFYAFEVRAVDNVGQAELFQDTPEATIIVDAEPPFVQPRLWLPVIMTGE